MGTRSKTKSKTKTRSHSPAIQWEREKLRMFTFASVKIRGNEYLHSSVKLYHHLAWTGICVGIGIFIERTIKKWKRTFKPPNYMHLP